MNAFKAFVDLQVVSVGAGKLYCTTCGHAHFRYAFREIAIGKEPGGSDWIVHRNTYTYTNELGEPPRWYREREKLKVLQLSGTANLPLIKGDCHFPDWLGYLGLVLAHSSPSFSPNKPVHAAVCANWGRQLGEWVAEGSRIARHLGEVSSMPGNILSIEDLELVETHFAPASRQSTF